jgi:hypothetical protein
MMVITRVLIDSLASDGDDDDDEICIRSGMSPTRPAAARETKTNLVITEGIKSAAKKSQIICKVKGKTTLNFSFSFSRAFKSFSKFSFLTTTREEHAKVCKDGRAKESSRISQHETPSISCLCCCCC